MSFPQLNSNEEKIYEINEILMQISTVGVPCTGTDAVLAWSDGEWFPVPILGSGSGVGLVRCKGGVRVAPECEVPELLAGTCSKDHTPFCEEFWSSHLRDERSGCVVYSFGTADTFEVEEVFAEAGCQVHAFDPTDQYRQHNEEFAQTLGDNFQFHFIGLGRDVATASTFGTLSGPLLSLLEIETFLQEQREELSLSGNRIHKGERGELTVLKMGCEGCEWKALHQIATETPELLRNVHTIILEMHLETTHQMTTALDLQLLASFYDNYITKMGFKLAYLHEYGEHAHHHVHPVLVELGLHDDVCCYEVIFHRQV